MADYYISTFSRQIFPGGTPILTTIHVEVHRELVTTMIITVATSILWVEFVYDFTIIIFNDKLWLNVQFKHG